MALSGFFLARRLIETEPIMQLANYAIKLSAVHFGCYYRFCRAFLEFAPSLCWQLIDAEPAPGKLPEFEGLLRRGDRRRHRRALKPRDNNRNRLSGRIDNARYRASFRLGDDLAARTNSTERRFRCELLREGGLFVALCR